MATLTTSAAGPAGGAASGAVRLTASHSLDP